MSAVQEQGAGNGLSEEDMMMMECEIHEPSQTTRKRRSALSPINTQQQYCSPPPAKKTPPCAEKTMSCLDTSASWGDIDQTNSTSKKRLTKRRSSFVTGRKSAAGFMPPQENKIEISCQLPEDERLRRLHEAVLEQALVKLGHDSSDKPGIQQLTVQIREAAQSALSDPRMADLFKRATTIQSMNLRSDIDPDTARIIAGKEAQKKRYEEEFAEWERLLNERTELEANTKSRTSAAGTVTTDGSIPEHLTPAQRNLLSSRPDYQHKLDKLLVMQERLVLVEKQAKKIVSTMNGAFSIAKHQLQDRTRELWLESFRGWMSPRTLLAERQAMPDWTEMTE